MMTVTSSVAANVGVPRVTSWPNMLVPTRSYFWLTSTRAALGVPAANHAPSAVVMIASR